MIAMIVIYSFTGGMVCGFGFGIWCGFVIHCRIMLNRPTAPRASGPEDGKK